MQMDSNQPVLLSTLPLFPFQRVYEVADAPAGNTIFDGIGAYAIFDARRTLQYLGYSKNVRQKLLLHSRLQRGACQFFKVYFPSSARVGPDELESLLNGWVEQNGRLPPGNSTDRNLWEIPLAREQVNQRTERENERANRERSSLVSTRPSRSSSGYNDDSRKRFESNADDDEEALDFELDEVVIAAKKAMSKTAKVVQKTAKTAARAYKKLYDEFVEESLEDQEEIVVNPLDPFSPSRGKKSSPKPAASGSRAAEREESYVGASTQGESNGPFEASTSKRRKRRDYADPDYDLEEEKKARNKDDDVFQEEWFPVVALFGFVTFMAMLSLLGGGATSTISAVSQQTLPM